MSILTDDEINALSQSSEDTFTVIRETERAVIAKLAAGVGVEPAPVNESGSTMAITRWMVETPSGWVGAWDKDAITSLGKTAIAAARVQALEEAVNIAERENAADWSISGQIAREILATMSLPKAKRRKEQQRIVAARNAKGQGI